MLLWWVWNGSKLLKSRGSGNGRAACLVPRGEDLKQTSLSWPRGGGAVSWYRGRKE